MKVESILKDENGIQILVGFEDKEDCLRFIEEHFDKRLKFIMVFDLDKKSDGFMPIIPKIQKAIDIIGGGL